MERKRHIGNDIVNIIFMDEDSSGEETEFNPNNIKSQFTRKWSSSIVQCADCVLSARVKLIIVDYGFFVRSPLLLNSWKTPNINFQAIFDYGCNILVRSYFFSE